MVNFCALLLTSCQPNCLPTSTDNTMARDLAPDWILKETMAIQAQSAQWFKDKQAEFAGEKPLTLTVLGCGMRKRTSDTVNPGR